jgi:hypothetical protein
MENHQRFSAFGFFLSKILTRRARGRGEMKKRLLYVCFRAGKGALAVNLLACLFGLRLL